LHACLLPYEDLLMITAV